MKNLSKWIITIYVIAFVLTILSIISPTTCATTTRISQTSLPSSSENISTAVSTAPPSTSKFTSTSSVETSLASNSITTNTVLTNTAPTPETSTTSTDFLTDMTTDKILSTSDYSSSPTPNVTKVSTADFSSITSDFAVTTAGHTTAVSTAIDTTTWTTDSTTDSTTYNTTTPSSIITTSTISSSRITTPTMSSSHITTPTMSSSSITTTTMSSSNITTPTMSSSNISTTTMSSLSTTTPTMSSVGITTHTFPVDTTTDPTLYSTTVSTTDTPTNTQSFTTGKTTETTSYGMGVSTLGITTSTPSPAPDNTTAATSYSSTVSTLSATTNTPYASNGTTTDSITVSTLGIITTNHSTTGSIPYSTMVSTSGISTDTTTLETASTTYSPLPNTSTTAPTSVKSTDTTISTTVYSTNSTSYNETASTTHLLIPTTPTTGSTTISTPYDKPTSTTDTTVSLEVSEGYTTISTLYNKLTPTTDAELSTTSYTTDSDNTTVQTTTTTTRVSSTTVPTVKTTTAKPVTNAFSTTSLLATNSTSTEIVIDGCAPSPCQNGATCTSFLNFVACYCNPGYTGANCSIDINECASSPCQNGATCLDMVHGFKCICNKGYTDPKCATIIDCGAILGTIKNGLINNPTNATTYRSELKFECDEGYTLIGVSSIQCTNLGLWSGQIPTCHKDAPRTCKTENDSRGTAWTESPINTTGLLRCAEGFEGNITRQCSIDGIWQLPQYSCIRTSVKVVNATVENLKVNATTDTVNTALNAITTETTRSQNSTDDQKLTDGELTVLTTALETVASVVSSKKLIDQNITNSFIESASNLIDGTNKDSWKTLSSTNNGAEKVLSAVSSLGVALATSLENGGNKTTIIKNNIAMEVKKIANEKVQFPDPHTNASDKEAQWITQSKSNIQLDSVALSRSGSNVTYITTAVMYRDMSEILPSKRSSRNGSDEATEEKEKINGPILALSITPAYNETLDPPVTITFKHQLTNYTSPLCSYWSSHNDSQGWSSKGCKVNSTNDSFTVCTCNHLTNFAILMSPFREADTSSKALRTISIVGISVSIVCLIAVFVLHFALWRYLRNDRTTVLMNLCVALLLSYIIFLAGVDRTESNVACTIIAAILHYIYLVVFCVMLVEGILIATIVHFVFNSKFRVKILLVIAWVLPAVIVGISLGVSKTLGYGNNSVCWLSTDKGLIWAFVGPALTIITFNVVCILIVIRAIFSTKAMETKKASEKVKTSLRSLAVLVPLMGVSWIVGIFYVDESLDFIQYIFAILNGLQGFFIFLFHCPLNDQVKKGLRLWRRRTSWTWLRTTSGTTSSKYKDSNELRETDRSYVDSVDYTSRSNNDWREKALDYNLPTLPSTSWLNRSKDSASRLSSHAYNTISDDWTSPRPFSSQI